MATKSATRSATAAACADCDTAGSCAPRADSDEDYRVDYLETLDDKRALVTVRDELTQERRRLLVTVREVEL